MPPALDLARRYAEALAALRAIHAFDAWLGDHWQEHCPPPAAAATAQTDVGDGNVITWHEAADVVIGYLPGQEGCFSIAREAALPAFPAVGGALPIPFGTDIVINAAMQDELHHPAR